MRAILAFFLLCGIAVHATDLDSVAVRFAASSPSVKAEKARLSAEYSEALDANILAGPEAEVEYKFGPAENRWGVSVGQSFDWPGVYSARRQANGVRATAFERLYQSRLIDKAVEIKRAVLRYCRARDMQAAYGDILANLRLMKDTYAKSLERGECTVLDLRRVEVEFFKANVENRDAENELKAAVADLRALGGDDLANEAAAFSYIPAAPKPFAVYEEAMEASNPELAYYKDLTRLADAELKVGRRSLLPSFKLAFIHDYEENTHFNGFGIGISLPTWNGKHRIAAARSNAIAATEALVDYRLLASSQLYADYDTAAGLYATVAESVKTFEGDEYQRLLKKALDVGKITLYEYLTDYLGFTDAKVTYIKLLYDYADADARLGRHLMNPL